MRRRLLLAPITAGLLGLAALAGFDVAAAQQRVGPGGIGATAGQKPAGLENVGFDQKLGSALPLDVVLRDEEGRPVRLGDFYGSRPVLLSFAYLECPMLCTVVLNGLVSTLTALPFDAGKDFEIVTLSFDHRETAELARRKKVTYVNKYGRPDAAKAWHFLTGDEEAIRRVTAAAGFRFAWDEKIQQFAHASGILVTTPEGKISHYLYGVEYPPRDVRLALVEASRNEIGSPVDQLLLYCFHYDPATGKYSATALGLVRIGGGLTLLALLAFIAITLRREFRARGRGAVARSVSS